MRNIEDFYEVCFSPGEQVWVTTKALLTSRCYAINWGNAREYSYLDVPGGVYLAINPGIGRRLIENVTPIRTFLVEFDNLPLEDQLKVWKASKLPASAVISSGGKSIHFWITLEDPISIGEYKEWFLRLWLLLGKQNDRQCGDPCRYSRMPGAKRDGKEQKLLHVGSRVPNQLLQKILYTPEITKQYEDMFNKPSATGEVYKTIDTVPLPKAIEWLNQNYPLITGPKQSNLLVWARYLHGSAGLTDNEQICQIIAENDRGNHKIYSEYERVVNKAVTKSTTKNISEQIWTDT